MYLKHNVKKEALVNSHSNVWFIRQVADWVDNWFEFIRGGDAGNDDAAVGSYKDETGQTPDAC